MKPTYKMHAAAATSILTMMFLMVDLGLYIGTGRSKLLDSVSSLKAVIFRHRTRSNRISTIEHEIERIDVRVTDLDKRMDIYEQTHSLKSRKDISLKNLKNTGKVHKDAPAPKLVTEPTVDNIVPVGMNLNEYLHESEEKKLTPSPKITTEGLNTAIIHANKSGNAKTTENVPIKSDDQKIKDLEELEAKKEEDVRQKIFDTLPNNIGPDTDLVKLERDHPDIDFNQPFITIRKFKNREDRNDFKRSRQLLGKDAPEKSSIIEGYTLRDVLEIVKETSQKDKQEKDDKKNNNSKKNVDFKDTQNQKVEAEKVKAVEENRNVDKFAAAREEGLRRVAQFKENITRPLDAKLEIPVVPEKSEKPERSTLPMVEPKNTMTKEHARIYKQFKEENGREERRETKEQKQLMRIKAQSKKLRQQEQALRRNQTLKNREMMVLKDLKHENQEIAKANANAIMTSRDLIREIEEATTRLEHIKEEERRTFNKKSNPRSKKAAVKRMARNVGKEAKKDFKAAKKTVNDIVPGSKQKEDEIKKIDASKPSVEMKKVEDAPVIKNETFNAIPMPEFPIHQEISGLPEISAEPNFGFLNEKQADIESIVKEIAELQEETRVKK